MTDKIIRFSELTPAKLLHANSVKVVIPNTDAVLALAAECDEIAIRYKALVKAYQSAYGAKEEK